MTLMGLIFTADGRGQRRLTRLRIWRQVAVKVMGKKACGSSQSPWLQLAGVTQDSHMLN